MAKATKSTALVPLEDWEQQLASSAKDLAAKETLGVPRISHKGGQLSVDGKRIEGNKLRVVVADYIHTNEFFNEAFEEGTPATPACYSYGREDSEMRPHPESSAPQAETCAQCPHNVFGTAEKGRGKRCGNKRKLLVLAPPMKDGKIVDDPDAFTKGEVRQITVPAGSLRNFGNYITSLRDVTRTGAVQSVFTEISTEPKGGAYALTFAATGALEKPSLKAVFERMPSLATALTAPWPRIEAEEVEVKPKKRRNLG